jgi:hypothetical protein
MLESFAKESAPYGFLIRKPLWLVLSSLSVMSFLLLQPISIRAQTSQSFKDSPREGGCGIGRPFSKAGTQWSGWSGATTGYAQAYLDQYSGSAYTTVAYKKSPVIQGPSGHPIAEANYAGLGGNLRTRSSHKTSFYISAHSYINQTFAC